jgi:methylase of polypeptide subunit release factors
MLDNTQRGDGAVQSPLPNLLQRTHEVQDDQILYRFGNGLTIKTAILRKHDRLRILPLGAPQGSLMNHMLHFPDVVHGKDVFEPFAGSGALGCMALKLGARHVDFLDVNPRAVTFQRENAALNHFLASQYNAIEGDIATFIPTHKYDLILANPPFVPTPDGIEGTLTSNGGPEGNQCVALLLQRLEACLHPDGQAFICLFQLVRHGEPLVCELLVRHLEHRVVELTPSQARPISFAVYCRSYTELFPEAQAAIAQWEGDLLGKYGDALMLTHYVAHVGPQAAGPTTYVIRENFPEKYGENLLVPVRSDKQLSYGRIVENILDFSGREAAWPS